MSTVIKKEVIDDDTSSLDTEEIDSSGHEAVIIKNETLFIKNESIDVDSSHETIDIDCKTETVDDSLREEINLEHNYDSDKLELYNHQTNKSLNDSSQSNTSLNEFILFHTPSNFESGRAPEYVSWNIIQTKVLINLYMKYINKIGTPQLKNMKRLWEVIANDINSHFDVTVTSANCENRWRVLERGYKKYTDMNKTGRKRKCFEYFEEMDSIFKKWKVTRPETQSTTKISNTESNKDVSNQNNEILDRCIVNKETENKVTKQEVTNVNKDVTHEVSNKKVLNDDVPKDDSNNRVSNIEIPSQSNLCSESSGEHKKKSKSHCDRNTILNEIRKERLAYQKEKLKLEKEKLEILRRQNELYAERNNILRKKFNIDHS